MLTKLVLINSCSYTLAELNFEGSHAMQLVGPNNVGKSSLIYALNFLFLVNRKLMSFSGERSADKETVAHYFPDPERSFIVFEIFKRGKRYCVLVRRDGEGELLYARLNHAYRRDFFFAESEEGRRLRNYRELAAHLVSREGVKVQELAQQQDVLRHIYQVGRQNDAAVWLTKWSKTSGATNSFSKVYRYLINSKLITNEALKEILLTADNRDQERLSYNRQNIQQIDRLRQQSEQLRVLRAIRQDFEQLRELVARVGERYGRLCRGVAAFHAAAHLRRADLLAKERGRQAERERLADRLRERSLARDRANRHIGDLEGEQRRARQRRQQLDAGRKELLQLPPRPLLEQQLQNKEAELERLNFRLREYAAYDRQPPAALERRLAGLEHRLAERERQHADIDNWLVSHIAAGHEERRLLNTILSPEVARLPRDQIRQLITRVTREVPLFDGAFALPPDLPLRELATPEQLADELADLRRQADRYRELLETARHHEDLSRRHEAARDEREQLAGQLRRAGELPALEEGLAETDTELERLTRDKEAAEAELRRLQEELGRLTTGIAELEQEVSRLRQQARDLERDQREIERLGLPHPDFDGQGGKVGDRDLRAWYEELVAEHRRYTEEREARERLFHRLRAETGFDLASEEAFVSTLEQELLSLDDKERSIDALLDSIAVQFANPARKFLDAYEEFRGFINNEFNHKLGGIRISNIESLRVELEPNDRLRRDLEHIAGLSLNAEGLFRQADTANERLGILREYLERGVVVDFAELFSLRLRLSVNGKARSVNLARQVESDGTDRMLRLIIIMTVISRLSDRTPDNRVVLFIDEIATIDGRNRPQLVEFCRQHHFYPIFAAPDFVDGFDRYVPIQRNERGQLVVDEHIHVIDVA